MRAYVVIPIPLGDIIAIIVVAVLLFVYFQRRDRNV